MPTFSVASSTGSQHGTVSADSTQELPVLRSTARKYGRWAPREITNTIINTSKLGQLFAGFSDAGSPDFSIETSRAPPTTSRRLSPEPSPTHAPITRPRPTRAPITRFSPTRAPASSSRRYSPSAAVQSPAPAVQSPARSQADGYEFSDFSHKSEIFMSTPEGIRIKPSAQYAMRYRAASIEGTRSVSGNESEAEENTSPFEVFDNDISAQIEEGLTAECEEALATGDDISVCSDFSVHTNAGLTAEVEEALAPTDNGMSVHTEEGLTAEVARVLGPSGNETSGRNDVSVHSEEGLTAEVARALGPSGNATSGRNDIPTHVDEGLTAEVERVLAPTGNDIPDLSESVAALLERYRTRPGNGTSDHINEGFTAGHHRALGSKSSSETLTNAVSYAAPETEATNTATRSPFDDRGGAGVPFEEQKIFHSIHLLRIAYKDLHNHQASLEEHYDSLNAAYTQAASDRSELQVQHLKTLNENLERVHTVNMLRSAAGEMDQRLISAEKNNKKLQGIREELEKKLKEALEEKDTMHMYERLAGKRMEENQQLSSDNARLTSELTRALEERSELSAQLSAKAELEVQNEQLKKLITESMSELSAQVSAKADLEVQNEQLKKLVTKTEDERTSELSAQLSAKADLEAQIEHLKKLVTKSENERKALKKRVEAMPANLGPVQITREIDHKTRSATSPHTMRSTTSARRRAHSETSTQNTRRHQNAAEEMTSAFIIPDISNVIRDAPQVAVPAQQSSSADHPILSTTARQVMNDLCEKHDCGLCATCTRVASFDTKTKHNKNARVSRPIPVSQRMPDASNGDDPTLRPSVAPRAALEAAIRESEAEVKRLKDVHDRVTKAYRAHDPSLGMRKRADLLKSMHDLEDKIESKSNAVYRLYDALEGFKRDD